MPKTSHRNKENEKNCKNQRKLRILWEHRLSIWQENRTSLNCYNFSCHTRCGKTTICQLFAALSNQGLHTVNCHLHTETSDFLGGLRPIRHHETEDVSSLHEICFTLTIFFSYKTPWAPLGVLCVYCLKCHQKWTNMTSFRRLNMYRMITTIPCLNLFIEPLDIHIC